jgi:hypothetical protein
MKKTYVFDRLDNVLGNYAEGKATENDVIGVANDVNRYLIKNAHPHDCFNCDKCDDEKQLEVTDLDGAVTIRKCPFCIESKTTIEIDKHAFGTLQMIRNYFGEHDKTPFEHLAFEVIDEIIKTNTP